MIVLKLNADDLILLQNALSEVTWGLAPSDLRIRQTYAPQGSEMWGALERARPASADATKSVMLRFTSDEAALLADALKEILQAIEEWEFQTRVGLDREEAIELERRISFAAARR